MNNKFCSGCEKTKHLSEFSKSNNKSGLYTYCKECSKIRQKEHREKNKDQIAQKSKDRYWNGGKEKSLAASKAYHYANKEERNRQSRENAEKNKEAIKAQRETKRSEFNEYARNYARNRSQADPLFKFKRNIRRNTSEAFRFGKKNKKTIELLGCSLEEAFVHIESLFQPGMTWENYGKWHIDHKVPLASANTTEEVEKLCHYTNLQPLWARENILKSDKLDWEPSAA
jgi:hypothetical protein